jgi:hypothetical protein
MRLSRDRLLLDDGEVGLRGWVAAARGAPQDLELLGELVVGEGAGSIRADRLRQHVALNTAHERRGVRRVLAAQ